MIKAKKTSQTQVILLGTGTPNADPQRSGPAVLIVCRGQAYLVDFGPGVVRRAAAAFLAHAPELDVSRINHVFCTHLHSDHTAGYADLIFTPAVLGRSLPLEVYGPPGIKKMTDFLLQAYAEDIRERIEGLEPAEPAAYQVQAVEITAGMVYKDVYVQVEAFEVRHGSWPAYAFRFTTPEGSIVISEIRPRLKACLKKAAAAIFWYMRFTAARVLKIARPNGKNITARCILLLKSLESWPHRPVPGLLVLYHQLFWGVTEAELLSEVQKFYEGQGCLRGRPGYLFFIKLLFRQQGFPQAFCG